MFLYGSNDCEWKVYDEMKVIVCKLGVERVLWCRIGSQDDVEVFYFVILFSYIVCARRYLRLCMCLSDSDEVFSIQLCVILFLSDLWQVGRYLLAHRFPLSVDNDHHDITEIVLIWSFTHQWI